MKSFVINLILFLFIATSISSCVMVVGDNGKHRGWFKNTNNPHHPNSTNPGHGHGKH